MPYKQLAQLISVSLLGLVLTGCASHDSTIDDVESRLRSTERALEACQVRQSEADERLARAQAQTEEARLRANELELRMSRMEARMGGKVD